MPVCGPRAGPGRPPLPPPRGANKRRPRNKGGAPVGPQQHLPRVLLILAGVDLVTLGAVLVAGLGRRAPASSARRNAGTSAGRRLAFGGSLMSVLGGSRRLHGLLFARFRHARPRRAAPATSSHSASGRRHSRPGSRPRARLLTSPPMTPRGPLVPTRRGGTRGLSRAHARAAGPLPRLPTEPLGPRASLVRLRSHKNPPTPKLAPAARCRRLTMPTRGALYNAGAKATSQQGACSLASPVCHSSPCRLPIGRSGARTVDPGGLCPHFRIRASRGLAEGAWVWWLDGPVPSGRWSEPHTGEAQA